MRAIILAAGRGSRFQPYSDAIPKCMAPVGGRPLIEWQIDTLRQIGVKDFVVVGGYRADMIGADGLQLRLNEKWQTTNMVESLFCAEDQFGNEFMAVYGDVLFEPRVAAEMADAPHEISVAVDTDWRDYWTARYGDPSIDCESLVVGPNGLIRNIGDDVKDFSKIDARYVGLLTFRGTGIAALRNARENFRAVHRPWMDRRTPENAYMTDLLMEVIHMGGDIHTVPFRHGWLEFDRGSDLELVSRMVSDGTIDRFFDSRCLSATTV